jgi:hypothetical protein
MQSVLMRGAGWKNAKAAMCMAAALVWAGVTVAPAGAQTDAAEASLVTGFDLEACIAANAPQFTVGRLGPIWGAGLEALAHNLAARQVLYLTVGVFGSVDEAADAAQAFVADSSIHFREGSLNGARLGEASWSTDAAIVFQRENVFVRVFSNAPARGEALADAVDRALADGAAYVARGEAPSRPTLGGSLTPGGDIVMGGATVIRIHPNTGGARELYYAYKVEGGELLGGDPPAAIEYRPSAPGEHLLRFVAVSNACVVSRTLEIPVTVVEGGGQ